jgi:hypothetical protein
MFGVEKLLENRRLTSGAFCVLAAAAPGSGKSAFADAFTEYATLRGKRCGYTATTGVAAAHRGITLASFLGLGVHKSGAGEPKEDLEVIEAKLRELLEKDACIDKVAQHHVCFNHTLFPLPLLHMCHVQSHTS